MTLNLIHLFAENMNIYGDLGNITAFKYRARKRNIDINYQQVNDKLDLINIKDGDIFFWGGGQDSDQTKVAEMFKYNKFRQSFSNSIIQSVNQNKVFLLICGGYQMFGKYYLGQNGESISGLDIIPIETYALSNKIVDRCIGNIIIEANLDLKDKLIIGFENHSGQTKKIENNLQDFGRVISGFGDNFEDRREGIRYKNVFGTYMHGPILPKNPEFTDYLIKLALENKYGGSVTLDPLDDSIENKARDAIFRKLKIK